MGCVISREASSGVDSESKGEKKDLSVESKRKVDDAVVPKVDSETVEVHDGGGEAHVGRGEAKKEENGHGGQRPPRGERRRSKPNPRLGNLPKQSRGEQVAAGGPPGSRRRAGRRSMGGFHGKQTRLRKLIRLGQEHIVMCTKLKIC
ncbi:hypothetical protein Pyn_34603 [Prunus yedoensis var. nudiflora]|uniref:Uncharacterized protein n=1 Tax=Prunus yedoensis var. nudiflora TaxID=2094558 RepID=A0A314YYB7_PRUYE|nr:hypothetical protein Pyn_34603 [Prunus yedoensis var. nudiflora]